MAACKIVSPWHPESRHEASNSICVVDVDASGRPVKIYQADSQGDWDYTELGHIYRVDPTMSTHIYAIPLEANDRLGDRTFEGHDAALLYVRQLMYSPETVENGHHSQLLRGIALGLALTLVAALVIILIAFR